MNSRARSFVLIMLAGIYIPLATAQQANHPRANLSVNGTGLLDASGGLVPNNANEPGVTPGSAALLHHISAPSVPLRFRVEGPPSQQALVVIGAPLPTAFSVGGQLVEVDLNTAFIFPILPLDANGELVVVASGGITPNPSIPWIQVAVTDPMTPAGLRTTASLSLEARGNIETLMRNWCDAATQTAENPEYMNGLTTTGYVFQGARKNGLDAATDMGVLAQAERLTRLEFGSVAPNSTIAATLPNGPPSTNQLVPFRAEVIAHRAESCGAGIVTERSFLYGLEAQDQGGDWRFNGDQRDADIDVFLNFTPGFSIGGLLDASLGANVTDPFNRNGGLQSVTVAGPQIGTILLSPTAIAGFGTVWTNEVPLGSAPLVENATGPRDTYQVTLNWNNPGVPPSGPYSVPARAAEDPTTLGGISNIAAALPQPTSWSPLLMSPSTQSAQLQISVTWPAPLASPFGALEGAFAMGGQNGGGGVFFVPSLNVSRTLSSDTINLCIPGMSTGSTYLFFERVDVYGNGYFVEWMGSL